MCSDLFWKTVVFACTSVSCRLHGQSVARADCGTWLLRTRRTRGWGRWTCSSDLMTFFIIFILLSQLERRRNSRTDPCQHPSRDRDTRSTRASCYLAGVPCAALSPSLRCVLPFFSLLGHFIPFFILLFPAGGTVAFLQHHVGFMQP